MKRLVWSCAAVCAVICLTTVSPLSASESDDTKSTEEKKSTQASQQQPTAEEQKPAASQAKRPQAKNQSLAGLASGISLDLPKGEGGSIVISNDNLQSMGEGAIVTEAKNALDGTEDPWEDRTRSDQSNQRRDEMDKVRKDMDRLRLQLDTIKATEEDYRAVNTFTGSGPQYRAPGQVDPLNAQKDRLQGEYDQAAARLKSLERAEAQATQRRVPRSTEGDGD